MDLGGWSWGAQFGDLNNDGTLDLYLVNGYVSAGERSSYWYDFSRDRRWTQRDHRRREELATDARPESVGLPAQARVAERRPRAVHGGRASGRAPPTPSTAAPSPSPISAIAARSTSSSRISADRCSSTRTRSSPAATGFSSSWRAARAIAAPSARESRCTGTGGRQVQEVTAAAASARRTSGALHFGLGPATTRGSRRHPLAVGPAADDRAAAGRHAASRQGARCRLTRRPQRPGPSPSAARRAS